MSYIVSALSKHVISIFNIQYHHILCPTFIEYWIPRFTNFEFYYIPFSDMCICIGHNISDKPIVPRGTNEDNEGAMTLKTLRDYIGWWPWARRKVTRSVLEDVPMEYAVDEWWKVYPSERTVRFNEMEFHVPREEGPKVIREIKEKMELLTKH